jgi:hypothetical protein
MAAMAHTGGPGADMGVKKTQAARKKGMMRECIFFAG